MGMLNLLFVLCSLPCTAQCTMVLEWEWWHCGCGKKEALVESSNCCGVNGRGSKVCGVTGRGANG